MDHAGCPCDATSVLELVAAIDAACQSAGVGALQTRVLGTARHEIPFQVLDASKLRERLGWASSVTLAEGLRSTIPWYREAIARG